MLLRHAPPKGIQLCLAMKTYVNFFFSYGKEVIREGREKWNEIGEGRDERRMERRKEEKEKIP